MICYDKVFGGFLGAAVGDAMGAITETLPIETITKLHDGFVREFMAPPDYVIAAGQPLGAVTDDYSLADHLAQAIIRSGGAINAAVADEAVMTWYEEGKYLSMMGPSIYECVLRIQQKPLPEHSLLVNNHAATNGGGMKIFPVGLLSNGNVEKAVRDAIVISQNSHSNSSSLAGACAIAAGVSAAMQSGADIYRIIEAAIYGARTGHAAGTPLAVPRIDALIDLAIEVGLRACDLETAMIDLRDIIGCGLEAYQSIPCAFGVLAATGGDVMQTLFATVNMGNDSDTLATMACAIAGTLQGVGAFPTEYISIIDRGNDYDIQQRVEDFYAVMEKGKI